MGAQHPADLSVAEAAALLAARKLSAVELTAACLARIGERDGRHSADGDPQSINAWIRVYDEDARAAAAAADRRRAQGAAPPLCGIPLGLKDLFAVAGKPLTASSRLLREVPARDCDVWARLRDAGMVLLGHLHTHEFAAGGTTDQVGNPWDRARSAGGSSGGSAAALAAGMVPAATGTDTAGSLRIPSACCGTSAIKPSRGLVSLRGVVPLAPSLDHAGPMARSLQDCALLLAAMIDPDRPGARELAGELAAGLRLPGHGLQAVRLAVSPRIGLGLAIEPEVQAGFDTLLRLCRRLGASVVQAPPDIAPLNVFDDFAAVFGADMLAWHRRFDAGRAQYRPSTREFVEAGESRALPAWAYVQAQTRRRETAAAWSDWLAAERIDAIVEPTLAGVAPPRGWGYDHAFADAMLIELTHYWNWTGFPVVAFPAGIGTASGLPVSASLIGRVGSDASLLALGMALQRELGVALPPAARSGV